VKTFFLLFVPFVLIHPPLWQADFDKALRQAKTEHKYVLLSFSGSDWCVPCIRLHKEVFESKDFADFAEAHLELVNADFPRLKKNQLSKEQQEKNEKLADQFNREGHFPYTVLLNEEGKIVKVWDGDPALNGAAFTSQLKELTHFQ
jgi:thioredoxin-related protein